MRVLVTGASGMIGSSVCDALLARGDEVVGLTRDPDRARPTNPTVTWHAWNPTLERPPAEALEGVNGVINVIGESINQRWTEDAKRRIRDSRIQATHNLVQAISAAERRPRALVSQSAIGYYGDRGDAVVDEDTPAGSSFDAEVCADWEAAARDRSAEPELERQQHLLQQPTSLVQDGGASGESDAHPGLLGLAGGGLPVGGRLLRGPGRRGRG